MANEYDVIVLGSGPGGYVAAGRAAQLGMNTVMVEKADLGGVCLNWGCIPTKALLESAHAWSQMQDAKKYGLSVENVGVDFEAVIKRSRGIADRMSKGVGFLMKQRGVTVERGTGYIEQVDNGAVTVRVTGDDSTTYLKAPRVIVATGGRPVELPGTPFDGVKVLHSTHAMSLTELPESMIIIGAGAIGMEFASFYRSLGTDVTIIEMMSQVLPVEDEEIVKELNRSLRRQKLKVLTDTRVTKVDVVDGGVKVVAETPKGEKTIEAEKLVVAIGVRPATDNIGLEEAGVKLNRGFVEVDELCQTTVPEIYAIGDITGAPLLAHKASAQGLVCVDAIAGLSPAPVKMDHIPGCTYCHPQVASVGLTEKAASERGINIKTGSFLFRANGRSIAMNETEGMVKLIFDADDNNRLVGAHILHAMASELIAELGVVLTMGGCAGDISHTVHAHPTLSEAVMEAAEDALGRPVHK